MLQENFKGPDSYSSKSSVVIACLGPDQRHIALAAIQQELTWAATRAGKVGQRPRPRRGQRMQQQSVY